MPKGKTYSDEFKQEALKPVNEQNMRPSQVARDLGSDGDTLRRWLRAQERTPVVLGHQTPQILNHTL